jgi:hypothetical protein
MGTDDRAGALTGTTCDLKLLVDTVTSSFTSGDGSVLASGPAKELGLSPQYQLHRCADLLLQQLPRFPGKGWWLIHAALRSPVIRNRMAIRALTAWPSESLGPSDREALNEYLNDPVESIRQAARDIA